MPAQRLLPRRICPEAGKQPVKPICLLIHHLLRGARKLVVQAGIDESISYFDSILWYSFDDFRFCFRVNLVQSWLN